MGMPITVEIIDTSASDPMFDEVYAYFEYVDEKFSTYKENSEISKINRNELAIHEASHDMQTIFALSEQTQQETNGYFNIKHGALYDPSGLVKGWSILNVATILLNNGFKNFYVEAGGDIQAHGFNQDGEEWRVGIRNPFNSDEIVKVVGISNRGIATSGTYIRGQHIYNPHNEGQSITDIMSITVIGPDIYEADRFATAAFAMGKAGIYFIERLEGFEGYMVDENQLATYTTGFESYVLYDEIHR